MYILTARKAPGSENGGDTWKLIVEHLPRELEVEVKTLV